MPTLLSRTQSSDKLSAKRLPVNSANSRMRLDSGASSLQSRGAYFGSSRDRCSCVLPPHLFIMSAQYHHRVVLPSQAQIFPNLLPHCRNKSAKASQRRGRRTCCPTSSTTTATSTLCISARPRLALGLIHGLRRRLVQVVQRLVHVLLSLLLVLLDVVVGPEGEALEGLAVGQALDEDFLLVHARIHATAGMIERITDYEFTTKTRGWHK